MDCRLPKLLWLSVRENFIHSFLDLCYNVYECVFLIGAFEVSDSGIDNGRRRRRCVVAVATPTML